MFIQDERVHVHALSRVLAGACVNSVCFGGVSPCRCARANASYRRETCLDVTVSPGPEVAAWCDPSDPCPHQIPDDHLAGCSIYPEADSPRRTELRPDGAGVPDADFLLYLHIKSTDKCRAEVRRPCCTCGCVSAALVIDLTPLSCPPG